MNELTCLACRGELAAGAVKCRHCGTHQNWRRWFDASSVVMAMLISLISVSTTAITLMGQAFWSKDSMLEVRYHGIQGKRMLIVAENAGTRGGIVKGARVFVSTRRTEFDLPFDLENESEGFIPPGSSRFFRMSPEDKEHTSMLWKIALEGELEECMAIVYMKEFSGRERMSVTRMDLSECRTLAYLLSRK